MIDTCVTPKNRPFGRSHTFVYTIATMSAECVFRFSNFKIRGTFHSSVLLFTSSDNKVIVRLTNGVHADKVTQLCVFFYRILELNLLKAILRIKLDQYASVRASTLAWLISYAICSSRLISEIKRLVTDIMYKIICNNQLALGSTAKTSSLQSSTSFRIHASCCDFKQG